MFLNAISFAVSRLTCNILYFADVGNLSKGSEESSGLSLDNFSKFSVWVSFFEIYNECFYDLLAPMSDDKKKKTLRLAPDIKGYSYVKGNWNALQTAKLVMEKCYFCNNVSSEIENS